MNIKKFKKIFSFYLRDKKKVLFLIYGSINVLFTNFLLQILLLYLPIMFATLISQIFNLNFGYYSYSKKVFKFKYLRINIYLKYLQFHIIIWILNWILINFISSYNVSKNFAALSIIPFLALLSFVYQKNIVFVE